LFGSLILDRGPTWSLTFLDFLYATGYPILFEPLIVTLAWQVGSFFFSKPTKTCGPRRLFQNPRSFFAGVIPRSPTLRLTDTTHTTSNAKENYVFPLFRTSSPPPRRDKLLGCLSSRKKVGGGNPLSGGLFFFNPRGRTGPAGFLRRKAGIRIPPPFPPGHEGTDGLPFFHVMDGEG